MRTPRRFLFVAAVLAALTRSAAAAIYSIPTNLNADGTTSGTSVNPPGWWELDGAGTDFAGGEGVHQIRLFVEVTGTTLDVLVFDPGSSGARDLTGGALAAVTTTYTLLRPDGTTLATQSIGNEVNLSGGDAGTTDNRLVRFTPSGWFRPNSASANNVSFSALQPGLYEFRVTTGTGGESNAFGVQFAVSKNAATGQPTGSYNAYTVSNSDNTVTAAGATESAWVGGELNGGTPPANIVQPQVLFPYVNRGCSLFMQNFDMDADTASGAGGSGAIVDALGASTALTMSDNTDRATDQVTIENAGATNLESINYGMYTLTNNTGGTQHQNVIDWRAADWQGFAANAAGFPQTPVNTLRLYMPTAYAPVAGNPNATAPVEPIAAASARYVSGANPPVNGSLTRYAITTTVSNPTANAITNVQLTAGVAANALGTNEVVFAGNEDCFVDGTSATASCTFANSGTTTAPFFRRVTLATLAAGSVVSLNFEVTLTPNAAGLWNLTGAPAAGAPPPNTTVWAQYTPAFSSATFTRSETLGPICNLVVNVGGGAILTRATLRGFAVDATAGVVEFATGSQQDAAAFRIWATDDRTGQGPRRLLTPAAVRAPIPSSVAPVAYRVETGPITSRYLLLEEIDRLGHRRFIGPLAIDDASLREAFLRVSQELDRAGAVSVRNARVAVGRRAARLAEQRATSERAPTAATPAATAVKIETSAPGRVQVSLASLRAAGLPPGVAPRALRLWNQGRAVPLEHPDGSSIAFVAEPLATDFSSRNAYLVSWGRTPPMPATGLTRSDEPLRAGDTRVKRNTIYAPGTPEGSSPWQWDLLFGDGGGWPTGDDPTAGDFDLPQFPAAAAGLVSVRVHLVGRTQHLHSVDAVLNGQPVGHLTFEGEAAATLSGQIDSGALRAAGNQLSLTYASTPDDGGLVYLTSMDLGLPATAPATGAVANVTAYDPAVPAPGADFLLVTHPLFHGQADQIAALKRAQGFHPVVVDVDRAYDRFTGGVVDARAIQSLVRALAGGGRLRYVLLVGGDTFDGLDFLGTGAMSFIPSLLAWDGAFGRVPSENLYADVDGDGRPDVAIGRLPVENQAEADAVVAKIAGASAALAAAGQRQVFAVDNQAPGDVSFRAAAEEVAARMPAGSAFVWADVADGIAGARATLLEALREGALATHYFGHGGPQVWADEGLLTVDDVASLEGTGRESVVFVWACEAQWFQNLLGPAVNEALVLAPNGGALASFGPAGITDPALQKQLRDLVYAFWLVRGQPLGIAIENAKAAALRTNPSVKPIVEGWNLLGDPSLAAPLTRRPPGRQ